MKSAGMVVGAVMVAVAGGVYYGLDRLIPRQTAEEPSVAVANTAVTPAPAAAVAIEPSVTATEAVAAEPEPVAEPVEEVAAEPEPESAPEPEPEPEVVAAVQAPAPKPTTRAPAPLEPRPVVRNAPPAADLITPWWPNPKTMPRSQLKLLYAGQTQGDRAIALLFSEKLDPDSLKQNAIVRNTDGTLATGRWTLGKNERLATFKLQGRGRYTVVLKPGLADVTGHILGTPLQGPVYVQ